MSLFGLFQPIKTFLGLGPNKTIIDNQVFHLHTKVTLGLFVVLALLANGRQYFGEPIRCKARTARTLSQNLVDNFCWVTGTYTLSSFEEDQAHPGVGVLDMRKHEKVYHVYYQWVSFVLILQAAIFYFPRFLWKQLECGRMKVAVEGMDVREMDVEKMIKRIEKLCKSLTKYEDHGLYILFFFNCELLNCLNILIQIIITDKFLGGRFFDYGHRYLQHAMSDDRDAIHPLHNVFPQVTSCSFSLHGRGGDIVEHDIICVLPLNVINEKIYLVMWVWLWLLAVVSVVNLGYRVMTYTCPVIRNRLFHIGFMTEINKQLINEVCGNLGYGEWFFLGLICKNVDGATFAKFIERLAVEDGKKMADEAQKVSDMEMKRIFKKGQGSVCSKSIARRWGGSRTDVTSYTKE